MGAGGSSVDRNRHVSKPTDAVPNLLWSLAQIEQCEEKARTSRLQELLYRYPEKFKGLASQYVFVHRLMGQMNSLAMDNCRLHMRIELLEKSLRGLDSMPLARMEQEKRVKQLKEEYAKSLGAYDNARAGAKWLTQNCSLVYKRLMIEQELIEL